VFFFLVKSITIIRLTYCLKQKKSFHRQLLINKSLVLKMNKKSLTGGIYFFTICARNVSITFVMTSCECEEVTFHCRWRFTTFQL